MLRTFWTPYCTYLPDQLEFIADHNKDLKRLSVLIIRPANARFHGLRYLRVSKVESIHDLIAFLKANSAISSLCIDNLHDDDLSEDEFPVLIHEMGLSDVEITGDETLVQNFSKITRRCNGNLKNLNLIKNDFTRKSRNFFFPMIEMILTLRTGLRCLIA